MIQKQAEKNSAIGKLVKVKKPLLTSLETISFNEFLYIQSFKGEVGVITECKYGGNGKKIYVISFKGRSAYIHEDDLVISSQYQYRR